MKHVFVILMATVCLTACDRSAEQLRENISGADSVAINYFKGDGTMDSVTAVKIIRDKNSIEALTVMITNSTASVNAKCGYDGSLHIFKNDRVIVDIFFNYTRDECRQFLSRVNGRDITTELDDKAKEFLSSQKNK